MITVEQAKELANKEAQKNGFDFADFITEDKKLGLVFHFYTKDDISDMPMPVGLPCVVGLNNGKFSIIHDARLIFRLLDQKSS